MVIVFIPQSSAPDVWTWTEFLRTATGPAIAALVLIIGIYLKEHFDKRTRAQQWFRQTYISDAIDPLIAHFQEIQASLIFRSNRPFEPLSLSIVTKVTTVVRSPHVLGALITLESDRNTITPAIAADPGISDWSTARTGLLNDYLSILTAIRKELLNTKIVRERDVYQVAEHPRIRELTKRFDAKSEEFLQKQKADLAKLLAKQSPA